MNAILHYMNYAFCLESKIRHSTIIESFNSLHRKFCLESKIRHSTIAKRSQKNALRFALNPK